MKTLTLYTTRNETKYWLAEVTYTDTGMFAAVSEYGNFAHAWRAFGGDFEAFLLTLDADYMAAKLMSNLLRHGTPIRKAEKATSTFAEMILPALKDAIRAAKEPIPCDPS